MAENNATLAERIATILGSIGDNTTTPELENAEWELRNELHGSWSDEEVASLLLAIRLHDFS